MRKIKHINEVLFRAVALLFSAALLVLSLLNNISLAACSEDAAGLTKEIKELREENRLMRAELECSLSLEEIERYAREELGMENCSPEDIIYLGG